MFSTMSRSRSKMLAQFCLVMVFAFFKGSSAFLAPFIRTRSPSLKTLDSADCPECVPSAPSSDVSTSTASESSSDALRSKNVVAIEYCTGCNWMLRAAWMAQEVLQTFNNGEVSEVALRPQFSKPGGDFRVLVNGNVCWDRRVDKGFPQPKELKQRIRNVVDPDKDLGHNDRTSS